VEERIAALERMAAQHWRGTEEEWLGGWLLRAAEGFTGRANSALPLGDPGLPLDDALTVVADWYRARGLPPMIAIPLPLGADLAPSPGTDSAARHLDIQLSERTWLTRSGPAFFMVAGLDRAAAADPRPLPPGTEFRVDPEPDGPWLDMYHYRGQDRQPPVMRKVLTSAPCQLFASIRSGPGRGDVLAIGRLSLAGGWAGITAVEVDPGRRRAGLGSALTQAICAEAAKSGTSQMFLQVEIGNQAARALYERCGFRYSHRYHYRLAP
jgi:GNAT superfamily N-acetyltransferase